MEENRITAAEAEYARNLLTGAGMSRLSAGGVVDTLRTGADIETVEQWIDDGLDLDRCSSWIGEGYEIDDVGALAQAERALSDVGRDPGRPLLDGPSSWCDPVWVAIADSIGNDPLTGRRTGICWHPEPWRDAGFGPWAALAWTIVDLGPDEAASAVTDGRCPLDVIGYPHEGRLAVLRRGLRGPRWVNADGSPLPGVVDQVVGLGDPFVLGHLLLPAVGHVIVADSNDSGAAFTASDDAH